VLDRIECARCPLREARASDKQKPGPGASIIPALQDKPAATTLRVVRTTMDSSARFREAFHRKAEGPNIETGPSVNKINYADVWNHEDMKNDYETLDNLEINITNNDTTMTCKAKLNLYHPKTWKGNGDAEDLIIKNFGNNIEFKVPGRMKNCLLVSVRANEFLWPVKDIGDKDFFDSIEAEVQKDSEVIFDLTAVYRAP